MKLTTGRLGRPIPAAPPATLALLLALWSPAWAAAPDYDTVMALNEGRLYAEAFRALAQIESAANADPRLLRLLGDAYAEGHGVTENPATALALYQRAVSAGDAVAAVRLGAMYERGAGVPQSPRQAFDWYVKVADREAEAAFKVASGMLANPDAPVPADAGDPIERLRFAAEQGHRGAQRLLGGLYMEGVKVGKDAALAAKWLEAAGEDTTESRRELGILYSRSDTPETRTKGMQLLQRAYDEGDAIAAAYLGLYAERAALTIEQKTIALEYYVASEQAAIPWAAEGRKRLETNLASLDLVGLKMQGARRIELIRHLQSRGASPAAGVPGVYDAFESSALVPGSESMTVMYAPGAEQYIAEVALRFASPSAAESSATYTQLRTRLDTSYGLHQEDASRRAARWRVGQAEVMLKFALPPQKVMVVYRFQPYADQLARAIEQSRSSAAGDGR
jgi:TPR repeat protein